MAPVAGPVGESAYVGPIYHFGDADADIGVVERVGVEESDEFVVECVDGGFVFQLEYEVDVGEFLPVCVAPEGGVELAEHGVDLVVCDFFGEGEGGASADGGDSVEVGLCADGGGVDFSADGFEEVVF